MSSEKRSIYNVIHYNSKFDVVHCNAKEVAMAKRRGIPVSDMILEKQNRMAQHQYEKIEMQKFMVDFRKSETNEVTDRVQLFTDINDPKTLRLMYDYNKSVGHAYQRQMLEVTDEY